MPAKIHPTAIVDPSAKIADGVEIGPYAVIGPDVEIGPGTWVGAHAVVEHARIASACRIHPHAFVGTPPQDLKYEGEKTIAKVGDRTVVRECVTINRGTAATGETVVGSDCLLMAYTHVAHDCVVGNGVIAANAATLAGHVEIGDNTVVGGLVAIHQFVRIGKFCMLGGGAMVGLDVPPYCMAQGDRAKLVGLNVVGLRRSGIPRMAVSQIKSLYKTVFLSGMNFQEALAQARSQSLLPEAEEFVRFLESKSHRGFCRQRKEVKEEEGAAAD